MSNGADWHDPFADDEAAQERERRRAEREARRRSEQESLGAKASESQAPPPPPPRPPTPPADEPPSPAAQPPPPVEEPPPPAAEPPPPTEVAPAADTPPPEQPPTEVQPPPPPPVTGAEPIVHPPTDEHAVPPPPRTGEYGRLPPRRHDTSRGQLVFRRLIGLIAVIVLAGIVAYGAVKVVGAIGGDDEEPAKPGKAIKVEDIVVPEGLDRRQIADVAKEAGLKGNYEDAVKKPPKGFDPGKYGAGDAPNLEGFLFPATYEVEQDTKVEDLVDKQLDAFKANLAEVDLSYAESKNLNVYDVLKIASMIEREIQVPEERELASAVIYNRLKEGTPLGIDATLRYYLQNYDEQLTESELADESNPYNTRVLDGLPPTPIGNPGLASIEAAANPAKSDAFFFVVKPGTCGEHVFVETEEEFAQAEAEYQAALAEEGGSPTEC